MLVTIAVSIFIIVVATEDCIIIISQFEFVLLIWYLFFKTWHYYYKNCVMSKNF